MYYLTYYSLRRKANLMPGPEAPNFSKVVLRVPDWRVWFQRFWRDYLVLPNFFKMNKIDIFHRLSGYNLPPFKEVFKIITVHDLRTLTINDTHLPQNINQYKKALKQADLCAAVSECTKRDLISHFEIDERKIRVVHLAASDEYQPSSLDWVEAVQKKFYISRPYFLSVGSAPRKNIERIIRAFAESEKALDFILVLVCHLDIPKYKELCLSLGVQDRVIFVNSASQAELIALYSGCYCFLFPSLYEGFGLPILEAMQCGAPVITSNTSACPEVATGAALLVNPVKISEISEAINQLCSNSDLRGSLIQKGFKHAKNFSWKRFGEQMLSIYQGA